MHCPDPEDKNTLIDSTVIALDTSNGSQRWQSADTGSNLVYTPVLSADGSVVYAGSNNKQVWAFLTSDGTSKWIATTNGKANGSPVLSSDGNTVYLRGQPGNLYAYNTADGSKLWHCQSDTRGKLMGMAGISSDGTTVMSVDLDGNDCRVVGFNVAACGETSWLDVIGSDVCRDTGVVTCAPSQHQCQVTLTAAATTAAPTTLTPTWVPTIAGIMYCVTTYHHHVRVAELCSACL